MPENLWQSERQACVQQQFCSGLWRVDPRLRICAGGGGPRRFQKTNYHEFKRQPPKPPIFTKRIEIENDEPVQVKIEQRDDGGVRVRVKAEPNWLMIRYVRVARYCSLLRLTEGVRLHCTKLKSSRQGCTRNPDCWCLMSRTGSSSASTSSSPHTWPTRAWPWTSSRALMRLNYE